LLYTWTKHIISSAVQPVLHIVKINNLHEPLGPSLSELEFTKRAGLATTGIGVW